MQRLNPSIVCEERRLHLRRKRRKTRKRRRKKVLELVMVKEVLQKNLQRGRSHLLGLIQKGRLQRDQPFMKSFSNRGSIYYKSKSGI